MRAGRAVRPPEGLENLDGVVLIPELGQRNQIAACHEASIRLARDRAGPTTNYRLYMDLQMAKMPLWFAKGSITMRFFRAAR